MFSSERARFLHRVCLYCQNKLSNWEENLFIGDHVIKCSKEYILFRLAIKNIIYRVLEVDP